MLTDDQLAARIGPRLRAELARLPAPDLLPALRRRRARRARVTAALTAVPVAAVAIAAAVFLPGGPAAPATQDTAYVVSHVTRALDAMPAGTILFSQHTVNSANDTVTDRWDRTGQTRVEGFTAGQLEWVSGQVTTRTARTAVTVNYLHKTWSRSVFPAQAAAPAPSFTCASAALNGDPLFFDPRLMAAWLRASVSCGTLKAGGTATVEGVTAIKLIRTPRNTPDYKQAGTVTYFVNPATYLPDRLTLASGANVTNLQWLPPTAANLAKLDLPVPPTAFTQISQ